MNRILNLSKVIVALAFVVGLGSLTSGCTESTTAAPTQGVACGSCIYGMEGVKGCELATKVDGKPYLVEGGSVDAHADGLCKAEKQAVVVGQVTGDKFVATKVELVK